MSDYTLKNETHDTQSQHTPGAIRAAEAITGGTYGESIVYETSYGQKTVKGIADLIDRKTAAPELLEAVEEVHELINSYSHIPAMFNACQKLQAVINKAK